MRTALYYGIFSSLVVVATVGIGVIPDSDARSIPAILGQAQNPSLSTCFQNNNGTIINRCSTSAQFCNGLITDDSGGLNVEITIRAPDINHNVSCFVTATNRNDTFSSFSGRKSPTVFGTSQILTLSVSLPGAGVATACCDLAPNASLFSLNY